MRINDYLEIKNALLQELKEPLHEERRKAIFEELVSINRVLNKDKFISNINIKSIDYNLAQV